MSSSISRVRCLALLAISALLTLSVAGTAAAKQTPPGDPPGNNRTIKIASDDDPEPDNEPHIVSDDCSFWVEFFGFDDGEEVEMTFTAHPPTGKGEELATWRGTISDDPAGGGQDDDDVIGFNLSDKLAAFEPHAEQGYHVKLQSDSTAAKGGSKQKVFWLECTPQPAGTLRLTKATSGNGTAPTGPFTLVVRCNHAPADTQVTLGADDSRDIPVPAGSTGVVSEPDNRGATRVDFTEPAGNGSADGQIKVTSGAPTVVTVTNVYGTSGAQAAGVGTQVAGESLTAPAAAETLPRTGTGARALAGVGAWALAVDGLALVATRRQ